MGQDIDFLADTFNSTQALEVVDIYQLWKSRLCIAVPKTNPLISKESLELRDLYGQHIITVKAGSSPMLDDMRNLPK